jgi:hypothetical protein
MDRWRELMDNLLCWGGIMRMGFHEDSAFSRLERKHHIIRGYLHGIGCEVFKGMGSWSFLMDCVFFVGCGNFDEALGVSLEIE